MELIIILLFGGIIILALIIAQHQSICRQRLQESLQKTLRELTIKEAEAAMWRKKCEEVSENDNINCDEKHSKKRRSRKAG